MSTLDVMYFTYVVLALQGDQRNTKGCIVVINMDSVKEKKAFSRLWRKKKRCCTNVKKFFRNC